MMVTFVAVRFVNLQDNIDGFAKLVGFPNLQQVRASLYTDGSYSCEKNQAGYGAYLQLDEEFHSWGGEIHGKQISCRYEHEALLQGIKLAKSVGATAIDIYIDCKNLYEELIERKTEWACNAIQWLDNCTIHLIYSHIGLYGNEFADSLSRMYLEGLPKNGYYAKANDYRFFKVQRVALNFNELVNRIKKSKKTNETFAETNETVNNPDKVVVKKTDPPINKTSSNKQAEPLSKQNPPSKSQKVITFNKAQADEAALKSKQIESSEQAQNTKSSKISANGKSKRKKAIIVAAGNNKPPMVILQHPETKKPYWVRKGVYDHVKNQINHERKKNGIKGKPVSDAHIAHEIYKQQCLKDKEKKKAA